MIYLDKSPAMVVFVFLNTVTHQQLALLLNVCPLPLLCLYQHQANVANYLPVLTAAITITEHSESVTHI